MTLPSCTTVGTVTAANILPPMLAPKILVTKEDNHDDTPLKEKSPSTEKPVATQEQMNEIFTKLDLSALDTLDPSITTRDQKPHQKSMLTSFLWVICIWVRLLW